VVGNWYDPAEPSRQVREAARDAWDIPRDVTCVAYAGGLAAERRLDLLIEAAAQRPYTFFLVAGRGDPSIEHRLREADARHRNFRFTGWLRDPEPLYAATDALYYFLDPAHPYSAHAASNTLHIAIARRLPLITSRVGEPGQVMDTVDPRLILDPPDLGALLAAIDLLGDSRGCDRIRGAMLGLQGRFNWKRASGTLLEAYQSVGAADSGHSA
jgi:glycosyltransferase involved in cell wall biosynthesis